MAMRLHNDDLDFVRGSTLAPTSLRPVPAFGPGRVCEVAACETVLSKYNDGERCWQHEQARPFQVRVRPKRTPAA
jgi:hypothetical protein